MTVCAKPTATMQSQTSSSHCVEAIQSLFTDPVGDRNRLGAMRRQHAKCVKHGRGESRSRPNMHRQQAANSSLDSDKGTVGALPPTHFGAQHSQQQTGRGTRRVPSAVPVHGVWFDSKQAAIPTQIDRSHHEACKLRLALPSEHAQLHAGSARTTTNRAAGFDKSTLLESMRADTGKKTTKQPQMQQPCSDTTPSTAEGCQSKRHAQLASSTLRPLLPVHMLQVTQATHFVHPGLRVNPVAASVFLPSCTQAH